MDWDLTVFKALLVGCWASTVFGVEINIPSEAPRTCFAGEDVQSKDIRTKERTLEMRDGDGGGEKWWLRVGKESGLVMVGGREKEDETE